MEEKQARNVWKLTSPKSWFEIVRLGATKQQNVQWRFKSPKFDFKIYPKSFIVLVDVLIFIVGWIEIRDKQIKRTH